MSQCQSIDCLPYDMLRLIAQYMVPSELLKFLLTCRRLYDCGKEDHQIWKLLCASKGFKGLKYLIQKHCALSEPTAWKNIARTLEGIRRLDMVHWMGGLYDDANSTISPQEAHAACLLDSAFAVIVGGWGSENEIDIIDATYLPRIHKLSCRAMVPDTMRFSYGFSTVKLDERSVIRYGGVSQGGYRVAVRDMIIINIALTTAEGFTVTSGIYSPPVSADVVYDMSYACDRQGQYFSDGILAEDMPSWPRGYHSACRLILDGAPVMLVWGGLGPPSALQLVDQPFIPPDERPFLVQAQLHVTITIARLEYLNLDTMQWNKGKASGQEPSPRFGHSCSYHDSSDSLIFVGGSNGTDLIRNGEDLEEIHILSIVRKSGLEGSDELVWSTPTINNLSGASIPGRCHCACIVADKIITFGGSANPSDTVLVIDLSEGTPSSKRLEERGQVTVVAPQVRGLVGPVCRTSVVGLQIGSYFFIHGGFHLEFDQLGDIWILDLAYSTAPYKGAAYEEDVATEESENGFDAVSRQIRRHNNPNECTLS